MSEQQEAMERLQSSLSEYMAQEIDKAVLAERERIIALLEAHMYENGFFENDEPCWSIDFSGRDALIALIKGENK